MELKNLLVSWDTQGTLIFWDPQQKLLLSKQDYENDPPIQTKISQNLEKLVVLSREGFLYIFDLDLLQLERKIQEKFWQEISRPKLSVNKDASFILAVDDLNRNVLKIVAYQSSIGSQGDCQSQEKSDQNSRDFKHRKSLKWQNDAHHCVMNASDFRKSETRLDRKFPKSANSYVDRTRFGNNLSKTNKDFNDNSNIAENKVSQIEAVEGQNYDIEILELDTGYIWGVFILTNSQMACVLGSEGNIWLVDLKTQNIHYKGSQRHLNVKWACVVPGNSFFMVCDGLGRVFVYKIQSENVGLDLIRIFRYGGSVLTSSFSGNGRNFALAGYFFDNLKIYRSKDFDENVFESISKLVYKR